MNVLFVCTGNTCRSPMLKFMFEQFLCNNNIKDIAVDSAGIMRHAKPITDECAKVLTAHGIASCNHISKFCDERLLEKADVIFTVSESQKLFLQEEYGDKYNIITLKSVVGYDIPDPYGKGIKAYEETYLMFENVIPKILSYITEHKF